MTSYLFIDGGCVRETLKTIARDYLGDENLKLELDYHQLTGGFTKVFYYDALPGKKPDETDGDYETRTAPDIRFLEQLSMLARFHVYQGDARWRRRRGNEQKKIDVMIAVDMLTHSFRRNMDAATLLTGDLDFKRLIDALVHEGMFVTLWHPPQANKELMSAADERRQFGIQSVGAALAANCRHLIALPDYSNWADTVDLLRERPGAVVWDANVDGLLMVAFQDRGRWLLAWPTGPGRVQTVGHAAPGFLQKYLQEVEGLAVPDHVVAMLQQPAD